MDRVKAITVTRATTRVEIRTIVIIPKDITTETEGDTMVITETDSYDTLLFYLYIH